MAKFHKILKTHIYMHIFCFQHCRRFQHHHSLLRYVKMPQSYILPQLNDKIQMGEGDFNERENITYVKHCDVWKSLIMQKQPINIAVRIWCKFSAFRSFGESIFSCLQVHTTDTHIFNARINIISIYFYHCVDGIKVDTIMKSSHLCLSNIIHWKTFPNLFSTKPNYYNTVNGEQ